MTGCVLDYNYFKDYYKIIVDLGKQQALDADRKAIQKINFTANLDRVGNTRIYFILEEAKETVFEFSQRSIECCECNFIECKVQFNFYQYKNDAIQQFKCKAIKFTA